jgi:hypothetical protein
MTNKMKRRILKNIWANESGLSGMLVLLLVMHFILIPIFGSHALFSIMLDIFWMLLLTTGIFSLAKNKRQAIIISIVPFLFIVISWISTFNKTTFIQTTELILSVLTFV